MKLAKGLYVLTCTVTALIILLFISFPTFAKEDYTTNHNITYTLKDGFQSVSHTISIEHNNKYLGLEQLEFVEPVENIKNISKLESNQNLYNIEAEGNKVIVIFKEPVIGPVTVEIGYKYDTEELFKKQGTTYILNVPQLENSAQSSDFNIYVNIEDPQLKELTQNFYFTKEDLLEHDKKIIIGKEMYYEAKITYVVDSKKNYIVVPASIEDRQEVLIKEISDDPDNVYRDTDNNLLFQYNNIRGSQLIHIEAVIKVYGNKYTAPKVKKDTYTTNTLNWDYKNINSDIQNFIDDIKTKKLSTNSKVENSYNFVTNYLSYNSEKTNYNYISRTGAENLNESNKDLSVCLEYSDLTIAILRALDIPTREINGYAVAEVDSVLNNQLHSWVEYLNDNNEWVQIDPTWGDTSSEDYVNNFDIYHINFLSRGVNSESPIPPGSYSSNNKAETVNVKVLGDKPPLETIEVETFDFILGKIIKNPHPAQIVYNKVLLDPFQTKFISKDTFINGYNTLYKIKETEMGIVRAFNVGGTMLLTLTIIAAISFLSFFIIHKKLGKLTNKAIRQTKNKVRSII